MKPWLQAVMWTSLVVVGCTHAAFPPDVVDGIDPAFDFARWHAAPALTPPAKIQLGGRILEAQTIGDTVTIVAAELAVARFPPTARRRERARAPS